MIGHEKAGIFPELVGMKGITEHLSLPEGSDLDRVLRYDTAIKRQMYQAIRYTNWNGCSGHAKANTSRLP